MAFEIPGRKMTRVAGGDLRLKQYCFVKLHTDGTVIAITANTDQPYGILQNTPNTGESAEIMKDGASKMIADEIVAIGDKIGPGSTGRGEVMIHGTDTTKYISGIALSAAGAADEQFTVDFSCSSPMRGA